MRVHVEEAQHFAVWLGGNLPTVQQWNKAAGLNKDDRKDDRQPDATGPYRRGRQPFAPEDLGIDREQQGPLDVGRARLDESPWGCRDMAGNGREWTRNLDFGDHVPLKHEPTAVDLVLLRGAQSSRSGTVGVRPARDVVPSSRVGTILGVLAGCQFPRRLGTVTWAVNRRGPKRALSFRPPANLFPRLQGCIRLVSNERPSCQRRPLRGISRSSGPPGGFCPWNR